MIVRMTDSIFAKINRMLRPLIFLCFITVTGTACLKTNKTSGCNYSVTVSAAPQAEQDSIKAYLDTNHISATKHEKGFYYQIVTPGTKTDSINLCTQVQANYKGQLRNGHVFDQQSAVWFTLGPMIDGWKEGIPLIGRGGRVKLYIPPTLGYGNREVRNAAGTLEIPANSILIFDVSVLDYTKN